MTINSPHIIQALATTIQELRDEHHLSQGDLAKRAGLTRDYISKLERGVKQNPTLQTFFKLAYVFNMTATELMSRIENS